MNIPPTKVVYDEDEIKENLREIEKVMRSGQVILGPKTEEFERKYANYCQRLYGCGVSSDTAAFEIIMRTIFEETNRRFVMFPALGFYSIVQSILRAGGIPVLMDMDLQGYFYPTADRMEYDIERFTNMYGESPAAVVIMHTGGLIAKDVEKISEYCKANDIYVFEDAAHCFGSKLDGKPAGFWGDASAFSLYATKPIQTCEGGVIVTDRKDWKEKMDSYRNYGRTHSFGISIGGRDGYSFRMSEIQAVMGLSELSRVDRIVGDRVKVGEMYNALFKERGNEMDDLGIGVYGALDENMKSNYYRYVVISSVNTEVVGVNQKFAAKGVHLPGKVYDLPVHKQPIMIKKLGREIIVFGDLHESEEYCSNHFCLPVYRGMTEAEVEYVVDVMIDVFGEIQYGKEET